MCHMFLPPGTNAVQHCDRDACLPGVCHLSLLPAVTFATCHSCQLSATSHFCQLSATCHVWQVSATSPVCHCWSVNRSDVEVTGASGHAQRQKACRAFGPDPDTCVSGDPPVFVIRSPCTQVQSFQTRNQTSIQILPTSLGVKCSASTCQHDSLHPARLSNFEAKFKFKSNPDFCGSGDLALHLICA